MKADSQTEAAVIATLNAYLQAYEKRDMEGVLARFAPDSDIAVLGPGPDEKRPGWVAGALGPDEVRGLWELSVGNAKQFESYAESRYSSSTGLILSRILFHMGRKSPYSSSDPVPKAIRKASSSLKP